MRSCCAWNDGVGDDKGRIGTAPWSLLSSLYHTESESIKLPVSSLLLRMVFEWQEEEELLNSWGGGGVLVICRRKIQGDSKKNSEDKFFLLLR